MDFVNNILAGKGGEREHFQFTRFGRGRYAGRAALNLQKSSKIKLRGSFEYANDFVFLAAELKGKFSGIIMSKENLGLENFRIPGNVGNSDSARKSGDFRHEKKKSGIFAYEVSSLDSGKIEEIKDKTYCMLLDAAGPGFSLIMKKKLPKPGKSGDSKIDYKFCQLEADLSYWNKIKEYFNLPEAKKVLIHHTFLIEDIILPAGEKDPEKLRLNAKRKGKIERKTIIDKQEKIESFNFEA